MQKLRELRKQHYLNQEHLAKQIGVSRSTIAMWETGGSQPDNISLQKLADFFNVTVDYLLGRDSNSTKSSKGIRIPVLGKVQAGIPLDAIEDILDYEEITPEMAAQGEHFALQIKGNSMSPRIQEGDVVIVRKQSDVENGDIAVVLVNGDDATIKKIKKRPEGIMLLSNNPSYDPMFYSNQDIQQLPLIILGKVVELRGKF